VRKNGTIAETTIKRELYFGIVLTQDDAFAFWNCNCTMSSGQNPRDLLEQYPGVKRIMDELSVRFGIPWPEQRAAGPSQMDMAQPQSKAPNVGAVAS